ncbi:MULTISPECIES: putative adhesin [unclassified Pseudomonas]|uniref:putative adhesin n=1 Tax=unclassified Pseudomonas TaxID=196821 RepID=UPI0011AF7F18|nr:MULTISPECIES: hypothetical protein [unclassified Pseudomonas]
MKPLPLDIIPLGEHFYLFQKTLGNPSKKLIITSHGAYVPGMNTRVPANTSLFFYGPDGKTLQDPGLSSVMRNEVTPFERREPENPIRNYLLSKYSKDSYFAISYGVKLEGVDVLAVRNRKAPGLLLKNSFLSLETALAELAKEGIYYEEVHCVFCRNFLLDSKPETHIAPVASSPLPIQRTHTSRQQLMSICTVAKSPAALHRPHFPRSLSAIRFAFPTNECTESSRITLESKAQGEILTKLDHYDYSDRFIESGEYLPKQMPKLHPPQLGRIHK